MRSAPPAPPRPRSRRRPPAPALVLGIAGLVLTLLPAGTLPGFAGLRAQEEGSTAEATEAQPAYHLQEGSLARHRIVVIGRDLRLDGEAHSHAVAINGSALVAGRVAGDVIVLGGSAVLEPTARVAGDVFVLGGHVEAAPGASIGGRSVAYPDASAAWLTLIEGPVLGLSATAPVVIGAKLALLAFWTLMMLLLLTINGREVVSTSESVRGEPLRNFTLGLTGIVTMTLTGLFFSAFSGVLLGLPFLVLVVTVALVLRFWGMVAVFHALGLAICRLLRQPHPLPMTAACYGLVTLGLLKLLPYVGSWVWMAATFVGVGAALSTKLGRREPWLQAV